MANKNRANGVEKERMRKSPKELRSVSVDLCGEKERGKKLLSRWAKLISLNSYARISCRWLTEEICEFACEVFLASKLNGLNWVWSWKERVWQSWILLQLLSSCWKFSIYPAWIQLCKLPYKLESSWFSSQKSLSTSFRNLPTAMKMTCNMTLTVGDAPVARCHVFNYLPLRKLSRQVHRRDFYQKIFRSACDH